MLNELALEKYQTWGGLHDKETVEPSYIESWRGRLPESLLSFWSEIGIGSMASQSLWLCKPEDYSEVLTVLFGADPQFSSKDCFVIAYDAFGKLYVWSERYQGVTIDLVVLTISSLSISKPHVGGSNDRAIWSIMNTVNDKDNLFDRLDQAGKYLYKRARKKLGPLAPGEVYGFVPALKFGGPNVLENLHRLSAQEHFSILAQIDTPMLMNFSAWPAKVIRPVG